MLQPGIANAAVIPTPPPGTAMPLSAPSPNPVQYNYSSGAVISSSAANSVNYKIYNDVSAAINALNGCSYAPGATITSVAATSPILASVGSCNPGSGASLTLSFSAVGQTVNAANWNASNSFFAGTNGSQTPQGAIHWGVDSSGYTNAQIASSDTATVGGVPATCVGFFTNNGFDLANIDCAGDVAFAGSVATNLLSAATVTATTVNVNTLNGGTASFTGTVGMPTVNATNANHTTTNSTYVNGTVNGTNTQILPAIIAGSAFTSQSGAHIDAESIFLGSGGSQTNTFVKSFDSAPICIGSYTQGSLSAVDPPDFVATATTVTARGANNYNVNVICIGS